MTKPTLLVVDDHPLNLKLMQALLTREFSVSLADNAEQALEVLESLTPDLILMDIQLPGMDGLEATRRIKLDPRTRDITVVALSAYAMAPDLERARQAGCGGYITKPIDTRSFVGTVRAHLQPVTAG